MVGLRSRSIALLAAVAFVIGTIAIPTLHLVFHAIPHDHVGDEIHYHFGDAADHDDHHRHHLHHDDVDHDAEVDHASHAGHGHDAEVDDDDDDDDDHDVAAHHEAAAPPHHQHGLPHDDHHHHDHEPFDPRHGEGSAAHFSLAISDSAVATVALQFFALVEVAPIAPIAATPLAGAHTSVRRFRGPPAGRT